MEDGGRLVQEVETEVVLVVEVFEVEEVHEHLDVPVMGSIVIVGLGVVPEDGGVAMPRTARSLVLTETRMTGSSLARRRVTLFFCKSML